MASSVTRKANKAIKPILVTSFTLVLLMMFLSPFAFMVFTSLKTPEQISVVGAPIWPAAVASFEYNGKEVDMYTVPLNT
ncbi:MAG TPA: carbohydrate ABC transporter permease, partial [Anaerolineae bacterium]|nr:carbohydrate ABC transporter permease [Anaerolineae bacterium]